MVETDKKRYWKMCSGHFIRTWSVRPQWIARIIGRRWGAVIQIGPHRSDPLIGRRAYGRDETEAVLKLVGLVNQAAN